MRKAGASAMAQDHALDAIKRMETAQDVALAKAKANYEVLKATAALPATIAPTGQAPTFAGPTLSGGAPLSAAGAKLDAFANDPAAQLRMAAQAYQDALSPQDKYKIGQQELSLLLGKGLIDQNAYTAAMAQLDQQMVKAATSAHKLQEEMQKLLERSNDASAGLKAYAIQLQINAAENGKFIYDALTAATKGAEDDAAKSLMMILEKNRGGHRQLIHDLEKMWSDYFKNLATMGIKHEMDQLLGPGGQSDYRRQQRREDRHWRDFGNGKIIGRGRDRYAGLSGAGTVLTHAGTELLSAAMALRAAAGMPGASSAGGGGGSDLADFASGSASMAFLRGRRRHAGIELYLRRGRRRARGSRCARRRAHHAYGLGAAAVAIPITISMTCEAQS